MDNAKKAIMCALVNRNIKSVLIRGPSGVAKSTLSRSICGISEKKLINIPLNTTCEQLLGGMDIEATLSRGAAVLKKGLLDKANGNVLCFDDINLADESLTMSVLDSIMYGRAIIEREGLSSSYGVDSVLVATMNPEERDLSDHILDRFDLCAYSSGEERKSEVLRRNLEFMEDPFLFCQKYVENEKEIVSIVDRAKKIMPSVRISDDLLLIVAELCGRLGAAGHRGDISLANTAIALAAINGRDEVIKKDVEEAAILCLSHRRNYSPPPPPPKNDKKEEKENDECERDQKNDEERGNGKERSNDNDRDNGPDRQNDLPPDPESEIEEMIFDIGEQFEVIDFLGNEGKKRIKKTKSRMGRRAVVESCDRTGRYSGYRIPSESTSDIALDATIREAAAHQKSRGRGNMAICIEESDIRKKIRERRSGCTIMFLVDASGSIGVRKRMAAVKGAILSMLKESYIKRDRVGMMAFRRDTTELILPPTKSAEYSHKKLEELPTGGKTPLGNALVTAESFMATYSRRHPGESCYVVLMTDGRANVPWISGSDAITEAQNIAENIKIAGVEWIVIDVGAGPMRFNHARDLSAKLGSKYFRLDEINAENLRRNIKAVIS
jgi:magnesium chelatase subunit D